MSAIGRVREVRVAEGTEHENTTTEGPLHQHAFPAGFWKAGKVVEFEFGAIVNDNNSTDTLTCLIRFGADGSTLANDTAIATSAAVDVADGDVHVARGTLVCRSVTAAGVAVLVGQVFMNDPDATGTIAVDGYGPVVISSVNTLAATYLTYAADWSVAHADNEVACALAIVKELA